jgi:hypothetical protein
VGRQRDPTVRIAGVNTRCPGGHFTTDETLDVISLYADTYRSRLVG